MIRAVSKGALGLVLALAVGGTASAAGWVQHNAPDKGFSAVFPKAPKVEDSTQDGVKMTSYAASASGALCIVIAADYPYVINPDTETVASRDNFAKGVSATVKTSKRIKFSRGATKLEAMAFDADSASYKFRSIIVIEGSRAYQIAGGVPIPDGDTAELDTCVNGLVLTPKS
jgi:hypothetical protein